MRSGLPFTTLVDWIEFELPFLSMVPESNLPRTNKVLLLATIKLPLPNYTSRPLSPDFHGVPSGSFLLSSTGSEGSYCLQLNIQQSIWASSSPTYAELLTLTLSYLRKVYLWLWTLTPPKILFYSSFKSLFLSLSFSSSILTYISIYFVIDSNSLYSIVLSCWPASISIGITHS